MNKHVASVTHFFVSNPMRLKLAIFAVVLALMLLAVMAPAAVALAGDATSGGHW